MTLLVRLLLVVALTVLPAAARAVGQQDYAANIASLIAPSKLATLKERGANPRIQKCVYWLAEAALARENTATVVRRAVKIAGYQDGAAVLTERALLRNLDIATKLGCVNEQGLARMRRGNAPLVTKGPCAGDVASVDHIIPRAVAPELDCVVANLELLPLRLNERKKASVGSRQLDLAQKLREARLLSETGFKAVLAHSRPR